MTTSPNYPAAASPLNDEDLILLWQNGQMRSATVSQLLGPAVSIRVPVTAIEDIAAGSFVNISGYNVRNAIASDPALFANGYVSAGVGSGKAGYAYGFGLNTALSIVSPFAEVWLSDTTPGSYSTTPPTTAGHFVQPLGPAIPSQGIMFFPQARVIL